jgi:pepF/M3 family oligoendopeptidase
MHDSSGLPEWDTSAFFPGLDSAEFAAAHEAVGAGVDRLASLYESKGVRATESPDAGAADEVIDATNALLDDIRLVNAYVYAFTTTDARNDRAQAVESELRAALARLGPLRVRLDAWLASFADVDALFAASPVASDHAHAVRRAAVAAAHQLTEPEEVLAAELNLSGGSAWNQLHGDVSSRLTAEVDGEVLPITAVRNIAFEADAGRRRRAYDAELAAWDTVAVPLAAALNGVKGQASTLNRKRGWSDDLEPALFANAVERDVLDAMNAAVRAALPDFGRYLAAKARLLGHADGRLPWWDLFAPVGSPDGSRTSWDEATATVADAFGGYAPGLRNLASRAVADGWIDVGPRDGKRGGAFCMSVRSDESRVLLNFGGGFDDVSTLAHELGHAYHNTQLADRTALQRATPMALAETASIFCETLLFHAVLEGCDDDARRLMLLESHLQGATQVVVDIHSRFLFESGVFAKRASRALSVAELRDLMTGAQQEAYGPNLDPDHLHRDMWAVKPHYYSSAFYNWPYTYGLLFGIGLYANYTADPDRFRAGYDDLLSATGLATASELAGRFGIDVADEAFWTASLDVLRGRIDDFEALAQAEPT